MARKGSKSKRRSGGKFKSSKFSVAMMAGFGTLLLNSWKEPTGANAPPANLNQYLQRVLLYTTGFAPWNPAGAQWQFSYTRFGLLPIATGVLVHYLANATGVNKGLGRLLKGIPVQI